ALITSTVLSGRKPYAGEGQRPNTLTVAATMNGLATSKDMAQRLVPVRVKRPAYVGDWDHRVCAYVERHRWDILADLVAALRGPVRPPSSYTRWGAWEREVLGRVADPDACLKVIVERRGM